MAVIKAPDIAMNQHHVTPAMLSLPSEVLRMIANKVSEYGRIPVYWLLSRVGVTAASTSMTNTFGMTVAEP